MPARKVLPRLWLMTDERADPELEAALHRLPRGAGVVFRHKATPTTERRARFKTVQRIARKRGLILILADTAQSARRWRAAGVHGQRGRRSNAHLQTTAVHTMRELHAAGHADLLFVSPVFATRSHPGAVHLGAIRFALLARWARVPVIALGGMDRRRGRRLSALGAYGWAAIDAWSAVSVR